VQDSDGLWASQLHTMSTAAFLLPRLSTRMSFEFVAVCPKGYEPDPATLAYAQVGFFMWAF